LQPSAYPLSVVNSLLRIIYQFPHISALTLILLTAT
jgi:hypothetical protein